MSSQRKRPRSNSNSVLCIRNIPDVLNAKNSVASYIHKVLLDKGLWRKEDGPALVCSKVQGRTAMLAFVTPDLATECLRRFNGVQWRGATLVLERTKKPDTSNFASSNGSWDGSEGRDNRPNKRIGQPGTRTSETNPYARQLFITNLPENSGDEVFLMNFLNRKLVQSNRWKRPELPVIRVQLSVRRKTPFAFVFLTSEEATACLLEETYCFELNDQKLRIQRHKNYFLSNSENMGNREERLGEGLGEERNLKMPPHDQRLYVGNLPTHFRDVHALQKALQEKYFSMVGGSISLMERTVIREKDSNTYALLYLSSAEATKNILSLIPSVEIMGRRLTIKRPNSYYSHQNRRASGLSRYQPDAHHVLNSDDPCPTSPTTSERSPLTPSGELKTCIGVNPSNEPAYDVKKQHNLTSKDSASLPESNMELAASECVLDRYKAEILSLKKELQQMKNLAEKTTEQLTASKQQLQNYEKEYSQRIETSAITIQAQRKELETLREHLETEKEQRTMAELKAVSSSQIVLSTARENELKQENRELETKYRKIADRMVDAMGELISQRASSREIQKERDVEHRKRLEAEEALAKLEQTTTRPKREDYDI